MITNKVDRQYRLHQASRQRLGDREAYTSLTVNQNGQQVRYFSSTDAEIYFGDIFIDEVVSIQYEINQNVQPIYGYNSYIYDDIAIGARIVNGQFMINFTKTNYMYEVLDTLKALPTDNTGVKRNTINERAGLWAYPQKGSNLKAGFDLYVSFGDAMQQNQGPLSSVTVLKNVVLTSCSTSLSASGDPVYEVYSFVAREVDFLSNGKSQSTTSTEPTTDKVVAPAPISDLVLVNKNGTTTLEANIADGVTLTYCCAKLNGSNITEVVVKDGEAAKSKLSRTLSSELSKKIIYESVSGIRKPKLNLTIVYDYKGQSYDWNQSLNCDYESKH